MNEKTRRTRGVTAGVILAATTLMSGAAVHAGEETVAQLPDYTVTATHFPELYQEVPSAVRVLGRATIEARPVAHLAEVLEGVGGLRFQTYSGNPLEAQVNLRGFTENGNQRVLVLVDGMKFTRPDMGGFNWSQIPLASVERVEILKGGHSTIYGNHAVAGVIKVETREGGAARTQVDAAAGDYGHRYFSLWTGGSLEQLGYGLGAEYLEDDGYRENSAVRSRAVVGTVHLGGKARWDADVRLHVGDSDIELPGPLNSVDFPDNPRASTDLIEKAEDYASVGVRLGYEAESGVAFEWVNGYNDRTSDVDWQQWGSHVGVDLVTWSTHPRARFETGPAEWVVGADFVRDELDARQYTDATRAALSGAGDLSRENAAGYAHVAVEATDDLRVSIGARLEHNRMAGRYAMAAWGDTSGALQPAFDESTTDSDHAFTLGLNWNPRADLRAWARVDRVYRYPGTDEVASYQGFLLPDPFNTDLGPETGLNYEIGAGWAVDGWTIEASAFLLELEDEIAYNPVTWTNTNLDDTRRRGIDLSVEWRIEPLTLRADYTWQKAEFTAGKWDGKDRYLVPNNLLDLSAECALTDAVVAGATASYTGSQYEGNDFDNSAPKLPSYWVAGVYLRWQLTAHVSLRASIDNLFDKEYATVKFKNDWLGGSDWYPANGRAGRVALQWLF